MFMSNARGMRMLACLLPVAAAAVLLHTENNSVLPHSVAPHLGAERQVQVWGKLCQTPFGVCTLVNPNGEQYSAPVGTPCFCGSDAGTVMQ